MKSTQVKYLMLLNAVDTAPEATHAELADAVDIPPSLVNRYLKRLEDRGAVRIEGDARHRYSLTPVGRRLVDRGGWQLRAFLADTLARHRERSVESVRRNAERPGVRRAVVYGATPLAPAIERMASDAGITVVATCDEERPGDEGLRLDDLERLEFDGFVLADWGRAEDPVLLGLLEHYAPVINPFLADGAAVPDWIGTAE
ncbi:MAG: winged helix-turn-helix transcriptional regulator [Planctomycetota bacterium]